MLILRHEGKRQVLEPNVKRAANERLQERAARLGARESFRGRAIEADKADKLAT